jgi:hypothetical protein
MAQTLDKVLYFDYVTRMDEIHLQVSPECYLLSFISH